MAVVRIYLWEWQLCKIGEMLETLFDQTALCIQLCKYKNNNVVTIYYYDQHTDESVVWGSVWK